MAADASIVFDTKLDPSGFDRGLDAIDDSFESMKKTLIDIASASKSSFDNNKGVEKLTQKLDQQLESLSKQRTTVDQLQERYNKIANSEVAPKDLVQAEQALAKNAKEVSNLKKAYDAAAAESDRLASSLSALERDPRGWGNPEAISRAQAALDSFNVNSADPLRQKLNAAESEGERLSQVIASLKLNPETSSEAQQLADSISQATDRTERLAREAGATETAVLQAMDEKPPLKFTKSLERGMSTLRKMGQSILSVGKDTNKSTNAIEKFAKKVFSLAKTVLVFRVIRQALRSLQTYLGGLTNTSAEFVSSLNSIKANLAVAFQPIFTAILPALNALMSTLATAASYLAYIMSSLFGTSYDDSKASAEALNKQAAAIEDVGGAAKAAKRELAAFDQINKQSAEDSGGGGGSGAAGMDFTELEEPPKLGWLDEFIEKLKNIFTVVDFDSWKNFGTGLADSISNSLMSISWDKIQASAGIVAVNLAGLLSGFLGNPDLWIAAGHTLAKGLNTAIIFLYNFLTNFEWYVVGSAIAQGINRFFKDFDFKLLGMALSAWVVGVLDFLIGIVEKTDWVSVGNSIGDFLLGVNWSGIAARLLKLLTSAFGGLSDFFTGLFGKGASTAIMSTVTALGALLVAFKALYFIQTISTMFGKFGSLLVDVLPGALTKNAKGLTEVGVGASLALAGIMLLITSVTNLVTGWDEMDTKSKVLNIAMAVLGAAVLAAGIMMGTGMTLALGPFGLILAAIMAVVAAVAWLFSALQDGKSAIKDVETATEEYGAALENLEQAASSYSSAASALERADRQVEQSAKDITSAEEELANAMKRVDDIRNGRITIGDEYIRAVKAQEEATAALEAAEVKLANSGETLYANGEELYAAVMEGTINYQQMSPVLREVYEAYIANENAVAILNDTMDDKTRAEYEAAAAAQAVIDAEVAQEEAIRQSELAIREQAVAQQELRIREGELAVATQETTNAKIAQRAALAAENEDFRKNGESAQLYKQSIMDAFANGEISAADAQRAIVLAMSEIDKNSRKAFAEGLPEAITTGLDPSVYTASKKEMVKMFESMGKESIQAIKDEFQISSPSKVMTEIGDNVFEGMYQSYDGGTKMMVTGAKTLMARMTEAIQGGGDGFVNAFRGVFNSVIDLTQNFANNVLSGIRETLTALRSASAATKTPISIPHIGNISVPRLAQGGLIPANSPRLVIVGDNTQEEEIVSPRSAIRQEVTAALSEFLGKEDSGLFSNDNSQTTMSQVILELEGTVLGRALVPILQREKQRRGVRIELGEVLV